jgi:histone-lysine N-methyltransferase SETMAR
MKACTDLREQWKAGELKLDDIVTGDESWILHINVQRKASWVPKGSSGKPIPKPGLHPHKMQLIVFWTVRGVTYWDVLKEGESINASVYAEHLRKMNAQLRGGPTREKTKELLHKKIYRLQHDNARPHIAKVVQKTIRELKFEAIRHPPYSPDLAPSDYHLFRSLKNHLRGMEFGDEEELRSALQKFFDSKEEKFYREGIEQLPDRWKEVRDNGGEYIDD